MKTTGKLSVVVVLFSLALGLSGCQFYGKLVARDHLNKGVKAYTSKRYEEAVQEFRTAIENDPTLVDAYLYLGTAYRAQFVPLAVSPDNLRKGQEAIATFEKVLEISPNNLTAMGNIADIYRNMSQPERAKDWYRKIMDAQEDKSEALYGIAALDYNMANDKTGSDGENVPNLTPEELAEVNRIVDEGIDSLKKALEIREDYSDAMEYLNLLYREKAELSDDEEAKRNWQREADRLALQALELKRQQQREAERARREFLKTGAEEGESGQN